MKTLYATKCKGIYENGKDSEVTKLYEGKDAAILFELHYKDLGHISGDGICLKAIITKIEYNRINRNFSIHK